MRRRLPYRLLVGYGGGVQGMAKTHKRINKMTMLYIFGAWAIGIVPAFLWLVWTREEDTEMDGAAFILGVTYGAIGWPLTFTIIIGYHIKTYLRRRKCQHDYVWLHSREINGQIINTYVCNECEEKTLTHVPL